MKTNSNVINYYTFMGVIVSVTVQVRSEVYGEEIFFSKTFKIFIKHFQNFCYETLLVLKNLYNFGNATFSVSIISQNLGNETFLVFQ